jgi:uncharacterized protein (DUF697 family)
MQDHEFAQYETGEEIEADAFELETEDEFESAEEFETGGELETGEELEFASGTLPPLNEVEELELAAELLSISSEEELDQFLGKLFKRVWKGVKKVGRFVGKIASPLGKVLKGIAKKALPFVGGALGSFIPIPGVGTALGSALGSAASKLLEIDLEGMSPEDQEFELARRFVRLAHAAAANAVEMPEEGVSTPQAVAQAVRQAAQGLDAGRVRRRRPRQGQWVRRGNKIVVLGV